ncbi:hypothetical protein SAMN05660662_0102 [Blastococcus aurantiacus]|uniref:DUF1641 domain-containing protein n=1 Tax=Blastococcus aurantiacus TaxID=1550231 RepID=A0A1G7QZZ0_9ACTN|nr:hypothetical protein [Blastococcus aurantiacus]SDG04091.1 hypothetical protein SAMN05660662_0102 [Blastococcus aurantiacus]
MPRADDVLTRAMALLDRAPTMARAVPPLIDTAAELLERLSAVLTLDRMTAVGRLVDRLDAALTPARVQATTQALDGLASRPDLLPRTLEAIDRLVSSPRLERLGDAVGRVLANPGLDRLLDIAADDRVERLLDLAADERVERLLDRLDVLLVDDRARRLIDRADEVLHDERLSRLGERLDRLLAEDRLASIEGLSSDDRVAAAVRVFLHLDRALSAAGPEALASLLERLPVLFTEERTAHLAALADRVPRMVSAVDGDLPAGPELRRVPADLHAMLEVLDDLHQVLSGMPGADRARARGADPHPQV